jgi:hypothetical protein
MKIRILNARYAVLFVPHEECAARDAFGWVDLDERTIFIDDSTPADRQRDTLWHEIMHALYEEYAFPARQGGEATVRWLGKAISEFIRSNRKFVRDYLT